MKIIDKFKDKINGVLCGFDRMIIKGHMLDGMLNHFSKEINPFIDYLYTYGI